MDLTKQRNKRHEGHEERMEAFLARIAEHGLHRQAARETGIAHNNHNNWLDRVPGYKERYEEAKAQANEKWAERSKKKMRQLAICGSEEFVRDRQGKLVFDVVGEDGKPVPPGYEGLTKLIVATQTVYYPGLLLAFIKANHPEFADQYNFNVKSETKTEVTHKFDYDAFARDFSAYARQRICERGDAGASGNGN